MNRVFLISMPNFYVRSSSGSGEYQCEMESVISKTGGFGCKELKVDHFNYFHFDQHWNFRDNVLMRDNGL